MRWNSSLSESPVHHRSRRLSHWAHSNRGGKDPRHSGVQPSTKGSTEIFQESSARHLCESGLQENCTSRLSGGRRLAFRGASSDPTLCSRIGCSNGQLRLGAGAYGKLYAVVHNAVACAQFNVSHGGGHGLIAFTQDAQVGVDVEDRARRCNIDGLIDSVFGPDGRKDLAAAQGRQRHGLFLKLRTLREALIKACGRGFSLDPSRFAVPGDVRQGAKACTFRFPSRPRSLWRLVDLSCNEFAAAVAYALRPVSTGSIAVLITSL